MKQETRWKEESQGEKKLEERWRGKRGKEAETSNRRER